MTSSGPNTQPMNFTHMFKFTDIRGNLPVKTYSTNSITDVLSYHPDFTNFFYLVKLAEMDDILDKGTDNYTLFVCSDSSMKPKDNTEILNMDQGDAKNIIKSSLLSNRIPKELLKDSPAAYFNTLSGQNRLFITNINDNTRLNNELNVIFFDIVCTNGIIHVVDSLINPLKL